MFSLVVSHSLSFLRPLQFFQQTLFMLSLKSSCECLAHRAKQKKSKREETRRRDFKCFKNACLSVCLRPKLSDVLLTLCTFALRNGFLCLRKVHSFFSASRVSAEAKEQSIYFMIHDESLWRCFFSALTIKLHREELEMQRFSFRLFAHFTLLFVPLIMLRRVMVTFLALWRVLMQFCMEQ